MSNGFRNISFLNRTSFDDERWKECSDAICSVNELDLEFYCECGERIQTYVANAEFKCNACGRIYKTTASLLIYIEESKPDQEEL